MRLRSEPLHVADDEAPQIFKIAGIPGKPLEYIENDFEDRDEVVFDHTTGLMWQKSGSDDWLHYKDAESYVEQLNRKQFAGHNDWRLPTISELMSLLEPEKQSNELYIDPVFNENQIVCWSSDKRSSESAWLVYFAHGDVYRGYFFGETYVRCVRS